VGMSAGEVDDDSHFFIKIWQPTGVNLKSLILRLCERDGALYNRYYFPGWSIK
jgi:hypothetical protein